MTMIRKLVRAQINALGEDEVEVVMSTAALARDGHILIPQGCLLDNYRANPIVLWSHDPDKPVGNAENVVVGADQITARVCFAPVGISHKADEIRGLTKAGVIRAVSVGFDPIEGEPLDPRKPRGGQRFSTWELLELSFVSVPSDTGAVVTARGKGESTVAEWKVGAARNLPVEDSDAWDGGEAEASIFEWAGGDDFDPAKARKGFLAYDASAPEERGSYKLPIAHAVGGELKVPKGAIRAAASRLPQTDIPDDVKERAQAVLDHYKKEAGMDDGARSAPRTARRRAVRSAAKIVFKRGLYEVAQFAYMLEQIGWMVDCAKYEAAIEGDASKVPAMLAADLQGLADTFLAMASEETQELVAGKDVEPEDDADDDDLVIEERAHVAAGATPQVRAFRRGLAHAKLRAGKTISAATASAMQDMMDTHEEAMSHQRSAMRLHRQALGQMQDMIDRSAASTDDDAPDANKNVQTSDGVDESAGSTNGRSLSADFRRRQAEALALAAH